MASADNEDDGIAESTIHRAQETDALHASDLTEAAPVGEQEGWNALSWSFAASGLMTVRLVNEIFCKMHISD